MDQVESVKADKALNVVLADGKLVQGTLTTQGGKVEIAGQGTTLAVAPADVSIIRDADEQKAYERLQQPRLLDLWAGAGTIGFAGTSGNAKTRTFTAGLTAARITLLPAVAMAQTRPEARNKGSWRFETTHPLGSRRAVKFPLGINVFREITSPNCGFQDYKNGQDLTLLQCDQGFGAAQRQE